MCLDAKQLNQSLEDDLESPPLINELLQKYHGAKYFTKLDLAHGYWQIPLEKESRKYTAFLFNNSLYQFCRVPFGIKTAGPGFMRALKNALSEIVFLKELAIYIDDKLIGTTTFEKQIEILEIIFKRLIEFNFTLNFKKCIFCQSTIKFLGFQINEKGIMPDPDKLKNIIDFEQPRHKTDLQSFLGVCNFYRQFNLSHCKDIDPLRELLKKDGNWRWKQEHSIAFEKLK